MILRMFIMELLNLKPSCKQLVRKLLFLSFHWREFSGDSENLGSQSRIAAHQPWPQGRVLELAPTMSGRALDLNYPNGIRNGQDK